jgi:class 3 adenylate cyclase
MTTQREQVESTIRALEMQRPLLGDEAVDTALAALRQTLATLAITGSESGSRDVLRQVSMLFLDVVGSTSISHRLDPEDTHAVMEGAFERRCAVSSMSSPKPSA